MKCLIVLALLVSFSAFSANPKYVNMKEKDYHEKSFIVGCIAGTINTIYNMGGNPMVMSDGQLENVCEEVYRMRMKALKSVGEQHSPDKL